MEGQNPGIVKVLDEVSNYCFGMTRAEAHEKDICLICKELAIPKCYSDAGLREYNISGVCEECLDRMMEED